MKNDNETVNGLTQEQIERRADQIINGIYYPVIPGLPDIALVPLTPAGRGRASRAYSRKLIELHKEGGLYSRALIPQVLKKLCAEAGLDVSVLAKKKDLQRQLFVEAGDLVEPVDALADDEVALLSDEEREIRQKRIAEREQQFHELWERFWTDDRRKILEDAQQVEALEAELRNSTYETHAEAYQWVIEALECARKADDTTKPYFADESEIFALDDKVKGELLVKTRHWVTGRTANFISPSSGAP